MTYVNHTPKGFDTTHAVYMVMRHDNKPYHIASAPTGEPVNLPRTRWNDKLVILGTHHTKELAAIYAHSLMIEHGITSNKTYQRTAIKCLTNNTTYKSAAAACKAFNINPATMSLHLNNPERYMSANGYIFRREV